MGNGAAKPGHLEKWEVGLLDKMFRDLAMRSPGKTMDKATFLSLFKLPGMLGERLFNFFDAYGLVLLSLIQFRKKNGVIDLEEFLNGMRVYSRGSLDERLDMLFMMTDLAGDGVVHSEELTIILTSLITPSSLFGQENVSPDSIRDTQVLVKSIVVKAYDTMDPGKTNSLSKDLFKKWLTSNPEIVEVSSSLHSMSQCLQRLEFAAARYAWDSAVAIRNSRSSSVPVVLIVSNQAHYLQGLTLECKSCQWRPQFCYVCGESLSNLKCNSCGDVFFISHLLLIAIRYLSSPA